MNWEQWMNVAARLFEQRTGRQVEEWEVVEFLPPRWWRRGYVYGEYPDVTVDAAVNELVHAGVL